SRFQQYMPAMAVLDFGYRSLGRSQQGGVLRVRETTLQHGAEPAAGCLSPDGVRTVNDEACQARIGRIQHGLTALDLIMKESCEVMMLSKSDTVVLGTVSLEKDVPMHLPPPGPTRNLREQLKQALRSTKIRDGERRI